MLFRIELRTDDPKLIEILLGVRNRAKFVKGALRHFISTKRGKETFRSMSKIEGKNPEEGKVKERQKPKESGPLPSDNDKKVSYDLDRFL
ncbi:MAG: hypothetical protein M0Z48_13310 [Nitrospiraceae bacterium]|nr:hypothetical protein [Nitrospiraceae bacterium]